MNKKILIANQIRTFGQHTSSMPILKFFKPYKLFDKIAERLGYFQYQSVLANIAKVLSDNGINYQDYDQSLYNRNLPIWKSYEPGSVQKIITY